MSMMMEKPPTGSYLYLTRESILSRQIAGESYTHVRLGKIDWGVNYALGYNNSGESLLSGGSHVCLGVNDWGPRRE